MTDLTELRRLLEEATPVPWEWQMGDPAMTGHHWQVRREGVPGIRMSGYTYVGRDDELAVAAVNALPELLDAAEALERVRALHQPYETGECRECSPAPYSTQSTPWPCPTIIAIDGEHSEKEEGRK